MVSSSEIRKQYIEFFQKKCGHTFIASSPVVPQDDPTLLFTNAGMNQFKPYFLGIEKPKVVRVVNTQKCIRAGGKHNDLDDVGRDTYHHTFFEMLGNWSFGDYFKRDAITWAWELLTQVWKLDIERLHVTVFEGDPANNIPRDDEAAELWKSVGVLDGHIHLGNKKDNFWEMGETGPCGPCTEVHFDRTPDKSGGVLVNASSPDVIEIWNNVFIQFNRNADKSLTPLPAQHVDTGMGFERICAVINNKPSNYDTDVFTPIFDAIQKATGAAPYTGAMEALPDIAYRVIADHIRMLTFALTDGAVPGNKGRGAVLRSVLRRASRYGKQVFGMKEPFLHNLVETVVTHMGETFPELKRDPEHVRSLIYDEERSFLKTLDAGIKLFGIAAEKARSTGNVIHGKDVFELHTTFGLDKGITQQMAAEAGLTCDMAEYERLWDEFVIISNAGASNMVISAVNGTLPITDDRAKYENELISAKVLGWVKDNTVVTTGTLIAGDTVGLLLDRTNFYAEQGGQVGDTGTIDKPDTGGVEFRVDNTIRLGDTVLHLGVQLSGTITVGDTVQLMQSTLRRIDIMRNHTGTHLMNLAMRQTLGQHVEQKGSLVDESKTRFDFSHDKPLTSEEIRTIENRVNRLIQRDLLVSAVTLPLAEAKQIHGVRAMFGEKYPDPVRVVLIGPETPTDATADDSVEFCGGTHIPRTGNLGLFKIISQESVAKGVRRITAVTGRVAWDGVVKMNEVVEEVTGQLQCKPEELAVRLSSVLEEVKTLRSALKKAQAAELVQALDALASEAPEVHGTKLIIGSVPAAGIDAVRTQLDRLRQKFSSAYIVLAWEEEESKVPIVVCVTRDLTAKGLKAGDLIKPIAALMGGTGGGKPDVAQAAGKDAKKLPEVFAKAKALAMEQIKP